MKFNGIVVLITDASSKVGADAARHFGKLGAKLSIVGKSANRLNRLAREIAASGSPIPLQIVADVTKDAERIVDETIKHFGKLDVLVNNTDISIQETVLETNASEFDRIFNANVNNVMIINKLCVPHLELTKGNIVNVSSVTSFEASPNCMNYNTSKAALDQFTKCSAMDLISKGIRVNAINSAAICRTPIFETFGLNDEIAVKMLDEFKKRYPIDRVGEVYDTSAAIAYLADNQSASFLTGVLLPIYASMA